MNDFLSENKQREGNVGNKYLLPAVGIGLLIVAAAIAFIALRPSTEEVHEQVLSDAVREGSPEFAVLTKKIAIETDENRTMQSSTGLGTIVMNIAGKIRNMTGKTLTGLEIKVGVVDSFGGVVKEKTLIVVPKQTERIANNEVFPVQVLMEGFNKDADRANIRWKVTAIKVE